MVTRNRMIDAGVKALLAHGYSGTGIGPLLASVAVPKGSFYHFFASKEAFAGAVLEAYAARYRAMRESIFSDTSRSPVTRLMDYFMELGRAAAADCPSGGCLYGVLAQSHPAAHAALSRQVADAFAQWEQDLARLLVEAQRAGEIDAALDPRDAAAHLIDLYEGVVLRSRAGDGGAGFDRFRRFEMRALQPSAGGGRVTQAAPDPFGQWR